MEINRNIARADKLPPIENQPAINKFSTPTQVKLKDPPVYPSQNNDVDCRVATAVPNVAVGTSSKNDGKSDSPCKDRKPSPYPGWTLVYDGFSKEYYYENNQTGALLFATPQVDPNGLKTDVEIQIRNDEKLARKLEFDDLLGDSSNDDNDNASEHGKK